MQHIDLNRLNIFKVVVLTGSFSKAALQLKIPKSRVSRQISSLESELKVPLIYRTTRSFQLTDAGRELYQNALPHLTELQEALSFLGDTRSDLQGLVRFTVPEDVGVELMGQICAEFTQLYPRIKLETIIDNRFIDLVKEGVDIALRMGKTKDSTLTAKRIGTTRLGIYASPILLQKFAKLKEPQDLIHLPFLSFFGSGTQSLRLKGPKGPCVVKLEPSFAGNNFFLLKRMALSGHGFTLLPGYLAKRELADGKLVHLLKDFRSDEGPVQLVFPPQKNMPPRIRTVIDFMASRIKDKIED